MHKIGKKAQKKYRKEVLERSAIGIILVLFALMTYGLFFLANRGQSAKSRETDAIPEQLMESYGMAPEAASLAVSPDPAPAEAVASGVTDGTVLGDESTSEVSEETSQPQETTPPVLTAAAITITLLNGNGVSGVAGSIADRLSEAGFQVKTDNAENWEYGANEIFFTTENREKAEMVLAQYAYAGWIIHEEQYLGQETDILIILGSDYSEL